MDVLLCEFPMLYNTSGVELYERTTTSKCLEIAIIAPLVFRIEQASYLRLISSPDHSSAGQSIIHTGEPLIIALEVPLAAPTCIGIVKPL